MEINWELIAFFAILFFALNGFYRGWWKEAIITFALAVLIVFLQYPGLAQSVINGFNSLLTTLWDWKDQLTTVAQAGGIATTQTTDTPAIDATDPNTWLTALFILMGGSVLIGRLSLGRPPTRLGSVLGFFIGGLNGFLALNLLREYLDGRALPGRVPPESDLTLVGQSAFGPADSTVSIQASNLPQFTILDSLLPWLIIGVGLLFLFSALKSRITIISDPNKGKKIGAKVPPFYAPPAGKKDDKRKFTVEI